MASGGSTPDHHNDSGAVNSDSKSSKSTVRKDRTCPFCHQTFTSSSLGRHLDFFIREKNPKAPDGVHDVKEIHKIRSGITRRHQRIPSGTIVDNSSRRWSVTSIASPKTVHKSYTALPPVEKGATPPAAPISRSKNWTATGVINDLPPRVSSTPLPRILPRPELKNPLLPHSYSNLEEIDDARAAELALKDVLRTIKSAANRAQAPVFEFDFFGHSFPALCLLLLPAPALLFSTTPISGPTSWPLGLPINSHFVALQEHLSERFSTFQDTLEDETVPNQRLGKPEGYPLEFQRYFDHLERVYRYWQGLSEQQKMEVWQLDMLRAYAQEKEKKQALQVRVDELQAEKDRLKIQVEDARKRQQWQYGARSEVANASPLHLPIGVSQSLKHSSIDLQEWDFDKLIAKYKPIVQKTRRQSDIRTAHERALPAFGPSDSLLLRPIMGPHGSSEPGMEDETPRSGRQASEPDEDSQDDDGGETDEDVDMEDEAGDAGRRGSRRFVRQGAG